MAKRKVERPTKEELEKIIWEKPMTLISKMYKVSDKTISKWCKFYKIEKPEYRYWIRNKK